MLLYINGNRITTKVTQEILRAATTPDIRQYYERKYKWDDTILQNMDWNAQHQATKTFTPQTQKTVHKYIHGWLPTGNHMEKRYKIPNQCPYCKQKEDERHLIRCTGQEQEKEKFKQQFIKMLKILQTENRIRAVLLTLLFTDDEIQTYDDHWIQQIVTEQIKIGRERMWKGFLTQQWGDYMEHHYQINQHERQYSGTLWAKRITQRLLTYGMESWKRRNEKLHEPKQTTHPLQEKLKNNITEQYNKHVDTPEILPCLYKHPLQFLLKKKQDTCSDGRK